ncbi:hypothetical protein PENANT_c002G02410 [Penicillium antarcticum]|uniref:Uncharacterized protein n=1 Tax=Penicillium antarcticum TaxID=416450 RepID=A0A1V6QL73_9EURO|nr:hypothetical protein PENANT_c002G02410 [Penicillium antarcticum]
MGSSLDWPLHPIYSPAQLSRYFDKLNLPSNLRREVWDMTLLALNGNTNTNNAVALSQMEALQRYQLASVPFENVDLHYSFHRSISTDTQTVLEKIVDSTSHRGGYCMENNILFGAVLQSMGYRITSVGGRVNEAVQPMSGSKNWKGPKYDGWNHMVNIVTIEGQKYLVDVTCMDASFMDRSPNMGELDNNHFGNMTFAWGTAHGYLHIALQRWNSIQKTSR